MFSTLNFQDVIVLGLFSFGYFCGGLAAAILAPGSWASLPEFYLSPDLVPSHDNIEVYTKFANYVSGSSILTTCVTTAVS